MPMKISAMILSRNGKPRARLRKMLSAHEDIESVAEYRSEPDAIEHIRQYSPDLVLLDRGQQRANSYIAVRSRGRTSFIKVQELDYLEAAHNNIVLHVGQEVHKLRGTLARMGE